MGCHNFSPQPNQLREPRRTCSWKPVLTLPGGLLHCREPALSGCPICRRRVATCGQKGELAVGVSRDQNIASLWHFRSQRRPGRYDVHLSVNDNTGMTVIQEDPQDTIGVTMWTESQAISQRLLGAIRTYPRKILVQFLYSCSEPAAEFDSKPQQSPKQDRA